MTTAQMFETRIDLSAERREKMVAVLNQQLADTFDLHSQAKQAHWNVKGPQFHQLHELFDTLAEQLSGYVDLIAERATALGGTALGTARMSAAASVVERVRAELPARIARQTSFVTSASVGYCVFDGASDVTAAELMLRADRARRAAKSQGRDRSMPG